MNIEELTLNKVYDFTYSTTHGEIYDFRGEITHLTPNVKIYMHWSEHIDMIGNQYSFKKEDVDRLSLRIDFNNIFGELE